MYIAHKTCINIINLKYGLKKGSKITMPPQNTLYTFNKNQINECEQDPPNPKVSTTCTIKPNTYVNKCNKIKKQKR